MPKRTARPSTPGLQPGQFALRVPLPGAVLLPDLIIKRIAEKALRDVVSPMVVRYAHTSKTPVTPVQGGCLLSVGRRADSSFSLTCGVVKVARTSRPLPFEMRSSNTMCRRGLFLSTNRSMQTGGNPTRRLLQARRRHVALHAPAPTRPAVPVPVPCRSSPRPCSSRRAQRRAPRAHSHQGVYRLSSSGRSIINR